MPEKSIPFDSLVLRAVSVEAQRLVGSRLAGVFQTGEFELVFRFGRSDGGRLLLLSCHPKYFRAHLITDLPNAIEAGPFAKLAAAQLKGMILTSMEQIGFDRRLRLEFGNRRLDADFLGTRANLTLWNGRSLVSRKRKVATSAGAPASDSFEDAIRTGNGLSNFLREELRLGQGRLPQTSPVWIPGIGAYAFPPKQINADVMPMASMSQALDAYYRRAEAEAAGVDLRKALLAALDAKRAALREMETVLDVSARARSIQMHAELLLAHAKEVPDGATRFVSADYEGSPVEIRLDPKLTPVENAKKLFERAKRAKAAAESLVHRAAKFRKDISQIEDALNKTESAANHAEIEALAVASGFVRTRQTAPKPKEERPFEGHKIKTSESPGGWRVLWGENATSNDYLTKRSKPNDYWFHVRGPGGSHVVLQTNGKPDRVQREDLLFAAQVAARHSGQKHAHHVAVSYTLAKYVRKPRKAPAGLITITNDKTLFVDP